MNELKIVIDEEMFISNITTNIVLPLYLEYDGLCFPNNQWTDFADILNMWSYKLLMYIREDKPKFDLYFMDGPYRLDITKDKEMKIIIRCINFRYKEMIEQTIQCDYIDLLTAVYKAANKFSKILYDKEMHIGRFEAAYKQSLITSKELKAAMSRL
ncbi:MAG: hypothetical protein E7247_12675 [Paenibacillaceae bacterium]|nr:hypothetical protein [Paenibacillaceae bacterium]